MMLKTLALTALTAASALPGLSPGPSPSLSPSLSPGFPDRGSKVVSVPESAQSAEKTAVAPLLAKVRLIGASVTAGYGTAAEAGIGGNVPMSLFLRATLSDRNLAADLDARGSNMFFASPTLTGKKQALWAKQAEPTLVIALDFLFWYGFGMDSSDEPRRLPGLEKGLAELDTLECPLIIGTLPNVDHSMRGKGPFGGPILHPRQIPSEADRVAMNERIREWAKKRKNVKLVDSESNLAKMVAGEPVEIRGAKLAPVSLDELLQPDLLHLKVKGSLWTALSVADVIESFEGADPEDFVFDAAAVEARFMEQTAEARAKRADRSKRR